MQPKYNYRIYIYKIHAINTHFKYCKPPKKEVDIFFYLTSLRNFIDKEAKSARNSPSFVPTSTIGTPGA